jgi:hypothetical protein
MYNAKPLPTVEVLNEWLAYNPETGVLTWKKSSAKRIKIGQTAGSVDDGYLRVKIEKSRYRAHRVIWKMFYGEDIPEDKVIDHVNRVRDDNRICNLRLVTISENTINSVIPKPAKSGISGILWCKSKEIYVVRVKKKDIKRCKTLEEAKEALQQYYATNNIGEQRPRA